MAGVKIGATASQNLAFAGAAKYPTSPPAVAPAADDLRPLETRFDATGLAAGAPGLIVDLPAAGLLRGPSDQPPLHGPAAALPAGNPTGTPHVLRGGRRAAPRTAIIHYWLVGMRGGERVLERLLRLYPEADIYTHVYNPAAVSDEIRDRQVKTTFIQKLPGSRKHYQKYLPLMPLALEQLDLRGYDLILSSESGPAKGVIVPPGALHVCYCHSPMRYLWDHYTEYLRAAGPVMRLGMPFLTHLLREWDYVSSARVDRFIANSSFIQRRIEKAYRRPSEVVFPPVDVSLFRPSEEVDPQYLWVGQMTPYKRADLAVDAFNELGLPLLMIGEGEMLRELKKRARPNVKIVPRTNFDELRRAYARCRALVFTAEEDFGMVPVEAMASGRPVLAFGRGGALDTVVPGVTGLFFDDQTKESLIAGVRAMEAWLPEFDPAAAMRSVQRFAPERFDEGVLSVIGA
jgi:glycosyltransferase involved in cell wall biosynthesis